MTEAIAKKATPTLTLADLIAQKRDSFAKVAARNFDPDRLVKLAQASLSRNPAIAQCTPGSVMLCLMKCAELGLEPDSALPQRRMWLVPRWNKKVNDGRGGTECTPQIDYRAQLQLARDSGLVTSIIAAEVCEKDEFSFERSPEGESIAKFRHRPNVFGDRGQVIGYYAAARLTGGEVHFVAMSRVQMETHRDRFAQKTREGKLVGPWASDFDAMALKTVLRRLWNLLPAGESETARRIQERIAEEAEDEARNEVALDVVAPVEAPKPTKTEGIKAKLAAKSGPAPVPEEKPAESDPATKAFEEEWGGGSNPDPTPPGEFE